MPVRVEVQRPPRKPADADPSTRPPPIVFVGGTGRSGTHVVARLLGRHSFYADVKVEARFHSNPHGLSDLLAGEVTPDEFLHKLRSFWWYRIAGGEPLPAVLPRLRLGRSVRGLYKVMPRQRFERALARFRERYDRDPESAARRLFLDLLWPIAARSGKRGLVEMTTSTVSQAPALARLFPEARFVHCIRDGRDCGSSKVAKRQRRSHPRNAFAGLEWWLERLETNEQAIAATRADIIFHLSLDQLAAGDREATYESLLEFLGLGDEPGIREYFDVEVNAEHANRGRWAQELSVEGQRELTRRYEAVLNAIEARGFASAPILAEVYERLG